MPVRSRARPQAPAHVRVPPAPMPMPETTASACRTVEAAGGPSPLFVLEAFVATVIVATLAFGWATVMVTTTAPLVAAVSLLARVVPRDDVARD